jgi:PIN domain nuclease of toxin-antitoxin system
LRLLLDTHILIWAVSAPARLSGDVQSALITEENEVFVSAATAWEISIKRALGRIEFPLERFTSIMGQMGFTLLPIQIKHAIAAGSLPRHHDDPFDRMLVAQAQLESLFLVSVDPTMQRYKVTMLDNKL